MKNRNLLYFIFSSAAINTGLWAATITVGLMGCYGSMTIAQCAYTWIVITAGALIAKILIGINLLQAEEAARGNRRQIGYCDKKTALDYTLEHKKQGYDSNDYIEVYRRYEEKIAKDDAAKKVASPAYYLSTRASRVYTGGGGGERDHNAGTFK